MRASVPSLVMILAQIPDPRKTRGRQHPWTALLLLCVAGLLSGANSQRALARWGQQLPWPWLRALGFTRAGGPSQSTLHRVLRDVEVVELETQLGTWLQQVRAAARQSAARWLDGIGIDGKTLRGARRLGAAETHLVSACCQRLACVLGEVAVADASHELEAVAPLLDRLLLSGETVTLDAHFTQYVVADQIVRHGGAYLMVVKGNQPTLLADIQHATAWPARRLGEVRHVALAHGRVLAQTLTVADARDVAWPHARQVLRLEQRCVHKRTGRVVSSDTRYAVTSLAPEQANPQALLRLWRAHWCIENALHWVRDVVFGEDQATTRTAHAPQAFAALRNLAIALLHLAHRPAITAARAYFATHPATLFRNLGLAPPGS
jgi:predicted transposase YbfD/YdcC